MTALNELLRELDPRKPVDPSQRALWMDALREATPEGERPPRELVKRMARVLEKSPQTIMRWHEKGLPGGGRPIWTPDEELILELFKREGVFRQIWNLLRQRLGDDNALSVRTIERGFHAVLSPAELAYCKYGAPGYRAAMTVFTNPDGPLHRNQLWELDAVELPIRVRVEGRAQPQKVWAIFVLDCGSRAIMSYALAVGSRPHRGHVMTALAVGIRGRHEHCPFRGLPRFVRTDNGLEFIARDVLDLVIGIRALPIPVRAWMAWHKGKIERFNWTVVQMLIRFLPGYLDGPRDEKGQLIDAGEPIALELLVQELEGFIDFYNTRHEHGGLGGRTPLDAWNDDEAPLKLIADEQLRFLLASGGTRIVQRQGVPHQHAGTQLQRPRPRARNPPQPSRLSPQPAGTRQRPALCHPHQEPQRPRAPNRRRPCLGVAEAGR